MKFRRTVSFLGAFALLFLAAAAWGGILAKNRGKAPGPSEGKPIEFPWPVYAQQDEQWWSTAEAGTLADEIVLYQMPDGGWKKGMNIDQNNIWAHSTIDNNSTWGQIRFLAKCYAAQGKEDYVNACRKGIAYLLNSQLQSGGWPQIAGVEGVYHAHITFNDDAMTEVMALLAAVANRSRADGFAWVDEALADEASRAFDRGVACILKCQIRVNGKLTAWCQQYDRDTLLPVGGRAYELPSICTRESVGIVRLLQRIPDKSPAIEASIAAALQWFEAVALRGIRFEAVDGDRVIVQGEPDDLLWARFYELDGITPLFSDRDGKKYYDVREISLERRTGYDWYGTWPLEVLDGQQAKEAQPGGQ